MIISIFGTFINIDDILTVHPVEYNNSRIYSFKIETKSKNSIEIKLNFNDVYPNEEHGTGDVQIKRPEVKRQIDEAREKLLTIWNKGLPPFEINVRKMKKN